ncbi:MAG: RiPP maturation radical SAM C-methyltransferase [Thermodesulfobacteriota bacterium]
MPTTPSFSMAQVAMPWPAFNRPSIQLGALKAFLATKDVGVRNFHPYLEVATLLGEELYQWLATEVWVCEALYSAILFPEQRQSAIALVEEGARAAGKADLLDAAEVITILSDHLERFVSQIEWQGFQLVGFSICLNQLLASLAAIVQLRRHHPSLPVVVGGSSCIPSAAAALCDIFAIDYVVWGEGELPLLNLCRHLSGKEEPLSASIYSRSQGGWGTGDEVGQLPKLSALPVPDYDDYFQEMGRHFPAGFPPVLPLEFSRGCWWGKCSFCNLNVQWHGYRYKKAEQMYGELTTLRRRYRCLDFTFTDNALPVRDSLTLLDRCAAEPPDYRFFAEIRASQSGPELARLRRGGLARVQVGIEGFSTSLLKRFNKGMRVIDNLAIMRDAVACGVELAGNLIVNFPGSSAAEVAESLENIDFAFPFQPLTSASFFLGAGSPVDCQPADYGILAKTAHPANKRLFPPAVLARFPQIIKGYRGDRGQQEKQWRPVVAKVKSWQRYHAKRERDIYRYPLLTCREGGDFLDIRQELPDGRVLRHRLAATSRLIYLECMTIISLARLQQRFAKISAEALARFLAEMVAKRLLFAEDDYFLALAVYQGGEGIGESE